MLPNECGECLHNHQDMYLYCGHQGAGKGGIVPEVRICPANGRPEWCPLGGIEELPSYYESDILESGACAGERKRYKIDSMMLNKINELTRVVNRLMEIANAKVSTDT